MFETSAESLADHLINDLEYQEDDLVFLFSSAFGLGRLKSLETITKAFQLALPKGLLIVPTFSYSWCNGENWSPQITPCPDMGAYSNFAWKDPQFVRTNQPNFSVAALKNGFNQDLIHSLFKIDRSCFGEHSIFGNILKYSRSQSAHILLLGGAFNDCLFRCTFIHYSQQLMDVPYRYEKKFFNPSESNEFVTQLVRLQSREEFDLVKGKPAPKHWEFPVQEDFSQFGIDLDQAGLLTRKTYGYAESRSVRVEDCCDFYTNKLKKNLYYCLGQGSFENEVQS